MAFISDQSCECLKSELDLFSVPPTQTSVESGNWIEYHPLTTAGVDSLIDFVINGTGKDYIDLANSMLLVQAKIINMDGTDTVDADPVGPVNLWLHSLFAQVHRVSKNNNDVAHYNFNAH